MAMITDSPYQHMTLTELNSLKQQTINLLSQAVTAHGTHHVLAIHFT
jgi:hypothetical protein